MTAAIPSALRPPGMRMEPKEKRDWCGRIRGAAFARIRWRSLLTASPKEMQSHVWRFSRVKQRQQTMTAATTGAPSPAPLRAVCMDWTKHHSSFSGWYRSTDDNLCWPSKPPTAYSIRLMTAQPTPMRLVFIPQTIVHVSLSGSYLENGFRTCMTWKAHHVNSNELWAKSIITSVLRHNRQVNASPTV